MKLINVLSTVNQLEKSKFFTYLERVSSEAANENSDIKKKIKNIEGQFKDASNNEILELFNIVLPYIGESIKEGLSLLGAQTDLLINILSRDGNCIAKTGWLETLYKKEHSLIETRSKELKQIINEEKSKDLFDHKKKAEIYYACFNEAFLNDEKANREAKITNDERGVLNVLAKKLDITSDDRIAIEHLVSPIANEKIEQALEKLREIGVVFIQRKTNLVYVPDEIVELLHQLLGKEIADKYLLRLLRTFSDAELSNILKYHEKPIRGVTRDDKIKNILKMGIPASEILIDSMHNPSASQNERKDRLKKIIEDLNLGLEKLGSTADERSSLIVHALKNSSAKEFNELSAAGYKEMFNSLINILPEFNSIIREEYELEEADLDVDKLRALGITPHDLLYLLTNEQIKTIRDALKLSNRGNPRYLILENFVNAADKLVENYLALSERDFSKLKANNLEITEAEIGIKFEEATKLIFEQIGLNVDEELRRRISTAKDKADILISMSDDDVIVAEVKSFKNGQFDKYSSTARQVKSYASRCESEGLHVAQVLIVAPTFSEDFITAALMDADINISLLEAKGLLEIHSAYKKKKNPKPIARLLTKGGLLMAEQIAKSI